MRYLLDVNVPVAWGWSDHADHDRVTRWLAATKKSDRLQTSAIHQWGFVRVSVQRSGGVVSPEQAGRVLDGMLQSPGARHEFVPDDQPAVQWPAWCQSASRTPDAHLLALAQSHGAVLATLDTSIPGAFVLP